MGRVALTKKKALESAFSKTTNNVYFSYTSSFRSFSSSLTSSP